MQENAGLFQKWLQMNTVFFNSNGKVKKDYVKIMKGSLLRNKLRKLKSPFIKRDNIPAKKTLKHQSAKKSREHANNHRIKSRSGHKGHDTHKKKNKKKSLKILHKQSHKKGKLYFVEMEGKKMKILVKKRKKKT